MLKVPHHGSETASTQAFIDAVAPDFVFISSSTIHHLPRDTVVARYRHEAPNHVVLRTDGNRRSGVDHLVCMRIEGRLTCNHDDVLIR